MTDQQRADAAAAEIQQMVIGAYVIPGTVTIAAIILRHMHQPLKPINELHEDDGYVLMHRLQGGRIVEPPEVHSLMDNDYDLEYFTHWRPLPEPPEETP